MTDDRPKSILELPEEFTREVIFEIKLLPDALVNHLLLMIDQTIAVLHATYADQLKIEHERDRLVVYRVKDTGEQMRLLGEIQARYDEETRDER